MLHRRRIIIAGMRAISYGFVTIRSGGNKRKKREIQSRRVRTHSEAVRGGRGGPSRKCCGEGVGPGVGAGAGTGSGSGLGAGAGPGDGAPYTGPTHTCNTIPQTCNKTTHDYAFHTCNITLHCTPTTQPRN